jgi:cytochrome c biogenesis protein ResB
MFPNTYEQEQHIAAIIESLSPENRARLEKLRRLYDLGPNDPVWAITAVVIEQTASQADLYRHIQQTRSDIEALKIRIDHTLSGLSTKADEFVIQGNELIEALHTSDNFHRQVTYVDRHHQLTHRPSATKSLASKVPAQPLPIVLATIAIAFMLGLLFASLLFSRAR